ncbi:hypothetical protein RIF29_32376 [Crotalaria pallida]|uniref:Uncharacterized protein n=1 Tax=Crotalaria pallida TaxID=3830 RepID=A0AAN9EKK5_CROPI
MIALPPCDLMVEIAYRFHLSFEPGPHRALGILCGLPNLEGEPRSANTTPPGKFAYIPALIRSRTPDLPDTHELD